jgi:hypothetical protein
LLPDSNPLGFFDRIIGIQFKKTLLDKTHEFDQIQNLLQQQLVRAACMSFEKICRAAVKERIEIF